MSKPYNIQYLDTAASSTGEMVCGTCGQPITEGQYRSAQKDADGDWHYVTHHRACTESDAGWASDDARRKAYADHQDALQKAAKAFYDEWDVTDLRDVLGFSS